MVQFEAHTENYLAVGLLADAKDHKDFFLFFKPEQMLFIKSLYFLKNVLRYNWHTCYISFKSLFKIG